MTRSTTPAARGCCMEVVQCRGRQHPWLTSVRREPRPLKDKIILLGGCTAVIYTAAVPPSVQGGNVNRSN